MDLKEQGLFIPKPLTTMRVALTAKIKGVSPEMNPLTKMLVALMAIVTMFLANVFILGARNKFKGFIRFILSAVAYLLLGLALILILIVLFSV